MKIISRDQATTSILQSKAIRFTAFTHREKIRGEASSAKGQKR